MNTNILSPKHINPGLLVIRLGMGLGFIYYHGWAKLMGGVERWTGLGESMQRFGIDFGAPFWGFMISFAEGMFVASDNS